MALANTTEIRSAVFTDTRNIIFWTAYSVVITVGVLENAMVIYLYVCSYIPKTTFNLCLSHLSLINIGVHLGVIPLIVVYDQTSFQHLGKYEVSIACAVVDGFFITVANILLSSLCLCLMSVMRYLVIRKPLTGHLRKTTVNNIMISLYVLCYCCSIPELFSFEWSDYGYCWRSWSIAPAMVWFENVWLAIVFFFPLFTLVVSYFLIWKNLYSGNHGDATVARNIHRRCVVVQLGILILVFLLCWIPITVYFILSMFGHFGFTLKEKYEEDIVVYIVVLLSLFAGIINPWCCAAFSRDFREGFQSAIRLKSRRTRSTSTTRQNSSRV